MKEISFSMIEISQGDFIMGANEDKEIDAEYHEEPERKVSLDTYYIQKTPVTIEQWMIFLDRTRYNWKQIDRIAKTNTKKNYPITYVSWYDANYFTSWLQNISGKNYSLPTEAQWEKACRGCNGQLYPLDKEYDWEKEFEIYMKGVLPVGHSPNDKTPFGCLDVWQNVSEWCLDWFDNGDYFHDSSIKWVNPKGPINGTKKVYRGGNPLSSGWPRCTYRSFARPEEYHAYKGFRIVLNP